MEIGAQLYTVREFCKTLEDFEETLKKIAEITGGKFYRATNLKELQNIYADIDRLEKTTVKLRNFTSYRELFQYFAGMAIIVLALKLVLANTKFRTLP